MELSLAALNQTIETLSTSRARGAAARQAAILTSLQRQLARVLERVGTAAAPAETSRELERINRELLLRSRIERIFLHQPEELFNELLSVILEVLDSPLGLVGYFEAPDRLLLPCLTRDLWASRFNGEEPVLRLQPADWSVLPWSRALEGPQTLIENAPPAVPPGHAVLHRLLAAPILLERQLLGLIAVANKTVDYSPDDRIQIELIGRYLAPILHTRLERQKDEQTRRQAEEALRQMQRMETIGTLAGGIAHEFNNLLAVILGHAELLRLVRDAPPAVGAGADAILKSTHRASELVRQLTRISSPDCTDRRPVDLGVVVQDSLQLLRVSLPAGIGIETTLAPDAPPIFASADQLRQVVLSLCTNAAQAMPGAQGRIAIDVRAVTLDPAAAGLRPGLRPGHHVRLTLEDTGRGMDEATRRRVFDPFFTTKAPGRGTGMGLAVVHRIVQDHQGAIEVASRPGEGTSFRIFLPAHTPTPTGPSAATA
jgi:signal transduction histidine kinase